jgi:hypothetical protein
VKCARDGEENKKADFGLNIKEILNILIIN